MPTEPVSESEPYLNPKKKFVDPNSNKNHSAPQHCNPEPLKNPTAPQF
jgi:hypothetical protein